MIRFAVPLTLFLVLAVVLGVGLTLNPNVVPSPLIGEPAPAFTASALHESARTLTVADLKGQVALVNVWASWCVACLDEHRLLVRLAGLGVPIYGLNYRDSRQAAQEWLRQRGDPYRAVIFDPDAEIGLDWGVYGVPETFLLDADGVIRHKWIGAITPEVMREEVLPRVQRLRQEADA